MRSRIAIECANEGCPGPAALEWMDNGKWQCSCIVCGLHTIGHANCEDAFSSWFYDIRYIVNIHTEVAL